MGLICLCLKSCAKVVLFFETANVWEFFLRKMYVFSSFLLFFGGNPCFFTLFYVCGLFFFTGCLGVVLYLQSQKNVKKGGPINVASRPFVGGAVFCVLSHIFIKPQHPAAYKYCVSGAGYKYGVSLLCVLLNLLHQHHILPSLFCAQPLLQHCALCKACFGE